MALSIDWTHNEEMQRWEATGSNFSATIDANMQHNVYVAWATVHLDGQPTTIAPQAFENREDAEQWCAEQIEQHLGSAAPN